MAGARPRRGWAAAAGMVGALVLGGIGCNGLLDIDDIEFADGPAGGSGGTMTGAGGGTAGSGTGTGAAGGSGAGGDEGGAGGAAPCPEDCSNGVDDDDNGLVDCEDPCCTAWTCIAPNPPAGWSGPVVQYVGGDYGVGCPSPWPDTAFDGGTGSITAPPATCSTCTCGTPEGVGCAGSIGFYPGFNCTGSVVSAVATGSCQAVPTASNMYDSVVAGESATGGSCTASGGVPTVVPATFETRTLACAGGVFGGGCSDASEVCAYLPAAPYQASFCIYRSGNRSCTGLDPYTAGQTVSDSIVDWRDCTDCQCTVPAGASCSGGTSTLFTPYTTTTCTGSSQVVSHTGTCANLAPSDPGRFDYDPGTASGGSCDASTSVPTGPVFDGGTVTLCCIPPS